MSLDLYMLFCYRPNYDTFIMFGLVMAEIKKVGLFICFKRCFL